MSDFDYNGWGTSPDRERLVLSNVSKTVVEVSYKPSEKQLKAVPRERPVLQVPLASFNAADETITIIPRRTRPSMSMLARKYPWLDKITIDADPFYLPDSEDRAADELLNLPDGFMGDWTWGLGVPKINQPILDVFRQTPIKHLHFTRSGESRLESDKFYIAMSDWRQLVADMNRITSIHQKDGLSERRVVAHNCLLARASNLFPRKQIPVRRNALSELIARSGEALSKSDRTSLVSEVTKRSDQLAREEPKNLAALQKTIELVTLDVLIERFRQMIEDDPVEAVWQELLQTNQFLLSMVFGFPVVLIQGQGTVSGPAIDGRGQKIADFIMAHDQTSNVALVEIKRASTKVISNRLYRDVPMIAGELTSTIMQVLDQRAKFLTELPMLRYRDRDTTIEAHAVGCVVVIGTMPTEPEQQRAFEIYRASFKDVSVITFDELLARLTSLKAFLSTDAPNAPTKPVPIPTPSPDVSRWSRPRAPEPGDLF
nr:Shedu anti-phage system protein SduA domain-containing protein [uncultured Brevundimonas sp.]